MQGTLSQSPVKALTQAFKAFWGTTAVAQIITDAVAAVH